MEELFVWTECFGCTEIVEPLARSFAFHHPETKLHVFCFHEESIDLKFAGQQIVLKNVSDKFLQQIYRRDELGIKKGYAKKSHLGTARAWANIIENNPAKYYVHLDADQVLLGNLIDEVVEILKSGFDIVGVRRPYFHRSYRKSGKDGLLLDKMQDAVNTDLLGFKRGTLGNLYSPIAVRKIRGKRTSNRRVIDFFDPIFFDALEKGCRVFYLDSQSSDPVSKVNQDSKFFRERILFAAVGSGALFWRNPQSESSQGYKEFALQSYSLWRKYMKEEPIDYKTLDAPELEAQLKKLDKVNWRLNE
jgi:hypothetical protein